mmetsp:Transcript_21930/g.68980  ORF Transcript_21930/g.68980 Transcript_21930/m.68980 type:complete len:292 (-) Transcript_21930:659-1534(-)|eukprot:scaffold3767_cov114-Isochrysis_galbana.AAC.17
MGHSAGGGAAPPRPRGGGGGGGGTVAPLPAGSFSATCAGDAAAASNSSSSSNEGSSMTAADALPSLPPHREAAYSSAAATIGSNGTVVLALGGGSSAVESSYMGGAAAGARSFLKTLGAPICNRDALAKRSRSCCRDSRFALPGSSPSSSSSSTSLGLLGACAGTAVTPAAAAAAAAYAAAVLATPGGRKRDVLTPLSVPIAIEVLAAAPLLIFCCRARIAVWMSVERAAVSAEPVSRPGDIGTAARAVGGSSEPELRRIPGAAPSPLTTTMSADSNAEVGIVEVEKALVP